MCINVLLKKFLLLSLLIHSVLPQDNNFEKIFYTQLSSIACVRILNSTSVTGCQSLKPASGVLIMTKTQESLDDFIRSNRKGKYIVILPYVLMTNDNLRSLESSGKMSGVLTLINGTDTSTPKPTPIIQRPTNLSPDEKCPNCQFDLYRNDENRYQWNPNGLGIIQERYDFPIFALYPHDKVSARAYNKITSGIQFNQRRSFERFPLRAIEIESLMFASVDASTCLRRDFCNIIGGHSVYSTPSFDMNENDGKPIIVVSAAMDSKSFFQDITLGLNNGISGSIALLAIADALSRSPTPVKDFKKHILFTLFAGESWGYLGSQRFVKNIFEPFNCIQNNKKSTSCSYDVEKFGGCTFPCFRDLDFKRINFSNIDSIIELSSVSNGGGGVQGSKYFVHVDDGNNAGNQLLVQGLGILSDVGGTGAGIIRNASEDGVTRKLPPSSSMAFLEKNRNIPAVVISDFQANLSNYYNSEYDDGSDLDNATIISSICLIANITSQAIWLHAQNLLSPTTIVANPINVNCTLIGELLNCLTVDYSCSLFKPPNKNKDDRISHYTGVFDYTSQPPLPLFHYNLLGSINADLTSDRKCKNDADCEFGEICANLNCTRSFTRYHHSYGAGLEYNNKGEIVVVDPEKTTWVESKWNNLNVRLYNMASNESQIGEFVAGFLLTALSIVGVIFGKKYIRKTLKLD